MPYTCFPARTNNVDTDSLGANGELLSGLLHIALHEEIARLLRQGGPLDRDYEAAREFGDILGERGDVLLYGSVKPGGKRGKRKHNKSSKPGETAKLFATLARAAAVGTFLPGGIALFGYRWIASVEEPSLREALAVYGAEGAVLWQ